MDITTGMTPKLQKAIEKSLAKQGLEQLKIDGKTFGELKSPKKPKYKVAEVNDRTVDGIVFDSKGEMQRYLDLVLLENRGEISELRLQPEFTLEEGYRGRDGKYVRPVKYIADFSYWENKNYVVEDYKGHQTSQYLLKRKLFRKKFASLKFKESSSRDIV